MNTFRSADGFMESKRVATEFPACRERKSVIFLRAAVVIGREAGNLCVCIVVSRLDYTSCFPIYSWK